MPDVGPQTDRTYKESIRRNRAETIREIKGFLGLGGPSSSGPSVKEMLIGTVVAFAIPAAIAVFIIRADHHRETAPPPAAILLENRTNASAPKAASSPVAAEPEMRSKYRDAVAEKKLRLERESDRLLGEYGKKCGNPQGKSMRLYCRQLDNRLDSNRRWILRH